MKITYWKGVFCAEHSPGDESLLRKSGFVMHEPTLCEQSKCKACWAKIGRRYWSARVEHATRLRPYCNERALAAMRDHLGKLATSRATDAQIVIPAPEGLKYLPYQKGGIAYALQRKDTLIADEMGLGKDQPLDAKILTPHGWTTMGDVAVGYQVIGSDGHPTVVTGTYPQGLRKVYKITFQDGSATECGENHLWEVNTPTRRFRKQPPRVLTTLEIMHEGFFSGNKRRHFVKLISAPSFEIHREHGLHPYLVGYILGNGGLSQNVVNITIPDQETIDRLSEFIPDGYQLKHATHFDYRIVRSVRTSHPNEIRLALSRLNMMGHLSADKSIPQEYMWGSPEDRIALLQGLIDSDGHVRPLDGNIEYSSSSLQLARDVQHLVWSLGGTAKIRPKKTKCLPSYRMSIILPNDVEPCRLTRKKIHRRLRLKYPPYRVIVKIEEVGYKETKCIKVDAPDQLYVTDDFILTHNTVEALGFSNYTRPKSILIVAPATLVLNWKIEAQRWLIDRYRIFIPKTTSDRVPEETSTPLLVVTNYEKIIGVAPRPKQIAVEQIHMASGPHESTPRAYLDELAQVMRVSGLETPIVVLQAGDGYRIHSGQIQLTVAKRLGWKEISAIVLGANTPPESIPSDARKIQLDTKLRASLRRQWDLGIFDEAHALKNPEAQRSLAVLGEGGLYHHTRRSLFLTGTPMENRPKEIWPIAATLCPARFGDWWEFARRYCGLHQESRGGAKRWVSDGSTNASELQQRLRTSIMVRRLKVDVLKELPPKRRQMVTMSDDNVDWSQYPELRQSNQQFSDYDAALARLEAAKTLLEYQAAAKELESVTIEFTECSDIRHKTGLLKLPSCLTYTDQLLDGGVDHVVIFAHHKDVLEKIHEHYGNESCVIYGDTKMKDRIPIVEEFQSGRKRVFIGGLRAAGTGITLTRAATLVFFESDWNPATMRQGEDRVARIGQKRMVNILHPVLNNSIDANMVQKMVAKQAVIDKVLDHLPEHVRRQQTGMPKTRMPT